MEFSNKLYFKYSRRHSLQSIRRGEEMFKKFLLFLPDFSLVCIILYITYTNSLSFGQMLLIAIVIGIIGTLVIRICKDVFTYIKWTIKQRKS